MESNLVIIILILILLLTYYFNNKFGMNINSKETFATIQTQDQTLNKFLNVLQNVETNISSQSSANLTPDQLQTNQDLMNQLNSLNSSIKLLIDKQNTVSPVSQYDNLNNLNNLNQLDDLQATQLNQDAYILQLQSRLDNLQKIYSSYLQKKTQQIQTVKYDKIPVYSSCIVAEANGQYTV